MVVRQFTVPNHSAISLPTKVATHNDNLRTLIAHKESANTGTPKRYKGGPKAYHFETSSQYERGSLSLRERGTGGIRKGSRCLYVKRLLL